MTRAYITKYALTFGVYSAEGDVKDDVFIQRRRSLSEFDQYFHGKEWHMTKEEAINRAEEMRNAKLKSLDKQIKKISSLTFEIK